MNALEMYDTASGITRDASGRAIEISPVDHWWNEGLYPMPIYKIRDALYCCESWNGEHYKAFRVLDRYTEDPEHPEPVTLQPIYRSDDEDREFEEDNDSANEIVGFDVGIY